MKHIALLMVDILSALIVNASMVLAQPSGGKPTIVDEKPIDLDSGPSLASVTTRSAQCTAARLVLALLGSERK
jgi:hypothetical protein